MTKTSLNLLLILLATIASLTLLRPRTGFAQGGGAPPALIAQVTVTRASDQSSRVLQSPDERVYLNASESASVAIELSPGNGVVRFRAPEGGLINGQRKIEVDTAQEGRNLSFTFTPGTDTGRFYIDAADDRTSETVAEFWVGPVAPMGRPGPQLTFN